jgi:hypothetical protein
MRGPSFCAVAMAGLVAGGGPTLLAQIHIVGPANNAHTHNSICPALDGGNQLDPDPVTHIDPPQPGQGVLAELANTANINFSGWNFAPGPPLNGTLTIEYYRSEFTSTHFSGGVIRVSYEPDALDPGDIRWIQLADTTDPGEKSPGVKYTSPFIDSFSAKATPPLPFYWTEKQNDAHYLIMEDYSRRKHPPTSGVFWRGYLYLVGWDKKIPGNVTIHDGIKWGWEAGCADPKIKTFTLLVTNSSGGLVFTWPTNSPGTNFPGWRLESTTNSGPASTWTPRTNSVQQTNGVYKTVLPIGQAQEYFRLGMDVTGGMPEFQPANVCVPPETNTVSQGHPAYLFVGAAGSLPIAYQWFKDTGPITDATNSDLEFPHIQFTDQGLYWVLVSNLAGSEQSPPAQLWVTPDITPPQLVLASANSNRTQIIVVFSEAVNPSTSLNTANYQVQGEFGPVPLSGASTSGDQSTVYLFPSTPLRPNSMYLLRASGISDFSTPPNYIPPGSSTNFTSGP